MNTTTGVTYPRFDGPPPRSYGYVPYIPPRPEEPRRAVTANVVVGAVAATVAAGFAAGFVLGWRASWRWGCERGRALVTRIGGVAASPGKGPTIAGRVAVVIVCGSARLCTNRKTSTRR
ncbi:hypothetical protein [Nocardia transvalensis]|uniref:hypothetical protein n=1 Tax=Nocardia transvalensis TaxID=37333 RepID=UPI001894A4B8|nr:hypothetical protein [Nocardia transvalensis]MBF6333593.1 hypothetical protein [Nocardia transvalensis]